MSAATSAAPTGSFTNAIAAEWFKLRSVGSTVWSLLGLCAGTLTLTIAVCAGASTGDDTVLLSLTGVYVGQLAVIVLAVLAVTSEYRTGTIRTTFVANPRRRTVPAAKIAVVAGLVFVCGLITASLSFWVGQAVLGSSDTTLDAGPAFRAVAGAALYLTALALLSLGLGAVLRHTAGATTAVLALLFVPTFAASVLLPDTIAKVTPVAGLAILQTADSPTGLPIGPWAGFGVLCAYAGAVLATAFWLVEKRDV